MNLPNSSRAWLFVQTGPSTCYQPKASNLLTIYLCPILCTNALPTFQLLTLFHGSCRNSKVKFVNADIPAPIIKKYIASLCRSFRGGTMMDSPGTRLDSFDSSSLVEPSGTEIALSKTWENNFPNCTWHTEPRLKGKCRRAITNQLRFDEIGKFNSRTLPDANMGGGHEQKHAHSRDRR